jgi:hypothetical protein
MTELEILKTLGTGGYAAVYLGKWLSVEVAIKKLAYHEKNLVNIISEVSLFR